MRSLAVLIVAVAIAGCGDNVIVLQGHGGQGQRGVSGGHADYAAALGPLPVVMENTPFAPPAVLAALQSNNARRLRFTADPPASLAGGYRLLLAFDTMPAGGLQVCSVPFAAGTRPTTPVARVYGAFCLGPVLISDAVASGPPTAAADDPRFGRLLGDLLSALMPFRPPQTGGNN